MGDMTFALEINNLEIVLGRFRAIDGISFKVEPGSFVAILGPNGSGKTTLLKAILGLIPDYSGEILVFGHGINDVSPSDIGYVPQLKTIDRSFPAVTCDLVASGIKRSWPGKLSAKIHAEVDDALNLVGAGHLCHEPLRQLSGGELQRVYLARAIVRKPKLFLLDEPATGIDAVGEDDMYEILESYQSNTGATIIMVTHDLMTARHHASHALLINRRLISFGPPSESLTDDSLKQAFGHPGHQHGLESEARDG
jgi:zinc transport system ATP-binding protein